MYTVAGLKRQGGKGAGHSEWERHVGSGQRVSFINWLRGTAPLAHRATDGRKCTVL